MWVTEDFRQNGAYVYYYGMPWFIMGPGLIDKGMSVFLCSMVTQDTKTHIQTGLQFKIISIRAHIATTNRHHTCNLEMPVSLQHLNFMWNSSLKQL